MKKKMLVMMLTPALLLGLVGCGETATSSSKAESSSAVPKSETSSSSSQVTDGYGSYSDDAGNVYTGTFVSGKYDGTGTMEYADGGVYVGQWSAGKREGTGNMTFDTACIYIGEWHDDNMEGEGYMKWPGGDWYHGTWDNGNPNGYGVKAFLRDSTGTDTLHQYDIYQGNMVDGYPDGKGYMNYYFGGVFYGDWVKSTRVGQGIYYWEETYTGNELKFVGTFSTKYDGGGWIDGAGTMYYKDGTSVTGNWKGTKLLS